MTHCPTCGSASIKPEPFMKGGSDRAGELTYYRCECRAVFSRLTAETAIPGTVPMAGEVMQRKAIAKPADAPQAEA